jgi:NAD-dependent dihydropyrimidine dehydrogenase PreA subunit
MGLSGLLAEHWRMARELRHLGIEFDVSRCVGDWQCYEVCPVGCWAPNYAEGVSEFRNGQKCVACGACDLQCPGDAIRLTSSGA